MKTHRNYLVAAGLLALMLALPCRSAAAPGQTSHFKFKGPTANAFFDSVDVTGCVETQAFVQGVNTRIKTVGPPGTTPSAFVLLEQVDNCSFTILLSATGFTDLPPGAFQIKKNLTTATLNTSIDVFDVVSNSTFPVDISVSWTGTGTVTVSKIRNMFTAPGFRENFMSTGASRAATASGSVTALGTNFSPSPAVPADLEDLKVGDLTVTH